MSRTVAAIVASIAGLVMVLIASIAVEDAGASIGAGKPPVV